uniref:Dynamin N-terminal domain-containing protein n=1 Tax=Fervidobacterium pennivorans TaxID=93466 RepID=A0A7V4KEL0_FERPE
MESKATDFVITSSKEQLKQALELGRPCIWRGKEELHNVLEELSDDIPQEMKIKMRVCREVDSGKSATFSTNSFKKEVRSLSELVKLKDSFDISNSLIFTEDTPPEIVFDTIQQLLNLGVFIDVKTADLVRKSRILSNLYGKLDEMSQMLRDFKKDLNTLSKEVNYSEFGDTISKINELADKIFKELKELQAQRTIKVAIFATKKSGKSMVVNALLGKEYAPTSLELPTPNLIIYKPIDGDEIIFEYNGKRKAFKSAAEVKKEIKEEYNKVKLQGGDLPPMVIYYPKKEGINYEIWDTPGPDLATPEKHKEIALGAIKNTDVAVFVIDYSKYAQESEIELLKEIKKTFESVGKKHSIIGVINKIDLMFKDANVEKNLVRVTDFIWSKFKELGFREFLVIPTTAMIYSYLESVAEVLPEIKTQENIRLYIEELLSSEDTSFSEEIKTYLTEISNYANYLRSAYGIKKPKYEDIQKATNFMQVEGYINYISQTKAKVERDYVHATAMSSTATEIQNRVKTSILLLSEQKETIKKALDEFLEKVNNLNNNSLSIPSVIDQEFEKMENEIKENLKKINSDYISQIIDSAKKLFEEQKKEQLEYLEYKFKKELQDILFGKKDSKEISFRVYFDLSEDTARSLADKSSERLQNVQAVLKTSLKNLEEGLKYELNRHHENYIKALTELTKNLQQILQLNHDEYLFQLPSISVSEISISNYLSDFAENTSFRFKGDLINLSVDALLKEKNWFDKFADFFKVLFGEKVSKYKTDEKAWKELMQSVEKTVDEQVEQSIKGLNERLEKALSNESSKFFEKEIKQNLDHLKEELKSQFDNYYSSVTNAVKELRSDLDKDIRSKEHLAKLYKNIEKSFSYISKILRDIELIE